MAGKKYEENHRVVFYETSVGGRVTLGHLVDFMMLASHDQSEQLGLTKTKLSKHNLGWVVTQHVLDITTYPVEDQIIKIVTQADSYNSFFCYRDFWIYDENDNQMAHMHSVFVLMNKDTRRVVRISKDLLGVFEADFTKKVERLIQPSNINHADYTKDYQVRYMDIDSNHHVNNAHYFDWMLDSLPASFLSNHLATKFNIVYKKEITYGMNVQSKSQVIDDNKSLHEVYAGNDLSCVAEVSWKKI